MKRIVPLAMLAVLTWQPAAAAEIPPPPGQARDFTLGAYYERSKFDFGGGQRRSRNNYRLSGMYAMGASEFHLNYGLADDFSGLNNSGASQWTLGYNYNLSKRTKLYAFYTRLDTDVAGADFSSVALGMRHNF